MLYVLQLMISEIMQFAIDEVGTQMHPEEGVVGVEHNTSTEELSSESLNSAEFNNGLFNAQVIV